MIVASGSVDESGTYVFEVEPQGVAKTNSKQAQYWIAAGGFDTMYSIWNPTDQPQDLTITLYYADGSGHYTLPVHLAGHSSTTIDLEMLIESQRLDAHGRPMPMTPLSGSAIIESAAGRKTPVTLVVSGGTYNVKTATCGQNCINCCGYNDFQLTPPDFFCPIGESMQCELQGTNCNGGTIDFNGNWSSSNPSIMTVNNSGLVTGVAAGTVTISAQVTPPTDVLQGQICSGGTPSCPTAQPYPNTSGTVQVPTHLVIIPDASGYTQGPPAPYVYDVNRQIVDSGWHAINAVMFVNESYNPNPASGTCTGLTISEHDGNSNDAGIVGPDLYSLPGNAPNPCSSTSTQSFVVTLSGHQYTLATTYTVNWQYSGVTVTPHN